MTTYDVTVVELPAQPVAEVRATVAAEELPEFLGKAYGEVLAAAGRQHVAPAGAPFGRYHPDARGFEVEAGFPTSGPVTGEGRVRAAELPGGLAARTLHTGDYGAVGAAYDALQGWMADHGYVPTGEPWECYLDGPDVPEPRTEVYFPCRAPATVPEQR